MAIYIDISMYIYIHIYICLVVQVGSPNEESSSRNYLQGPDNSRALETSGL